jgi:hypothetical protein
MTSPDHSALKARNQLLILFLLFCTLDIVLVTIVRDWWAIGRILLTIVVMYFVLQGQKWAKWLLIGICSLLAVILVALVFALSSKLSPVVLVGSLVMVVLSVMIPIFLSKSKNLDRYFASKRQARSQ